MKIHTALKILSALVLVAAPAGCDTGKSGDDGDDGDDSEASGTDGATDGDEESGAGSTGEPTTDATEGTTGEPEAVCDSNNFGVSRSCATGLQFCTVKDSTYVWGECVSAPVCTPDKEEQDDCMGCDLDEDGVPFTFDNCGQDETTPLVLSFDGSAVGYGAASRWFDLGRCAATDWPTAATPWLALDRDGSGGIEGGHELFGSATRLRGGAVADNGFAALRELDVDGDGRLTASDPGFAALVLWTDADDDRRSSGLELQPISAYGLTEIQLDYASDRRCDARGNCEVERASFTFADPRGRVRTGEVVDVHLACQ